MSGKEVSRYTRPRPLPNSTQPATVAQPTGRATPARTTQYMATPTGQQALQAIEQRRQIQATTRYEQTLRHAPMRHGNITFRPGDRVISVRDPNHVVTIDHFETRRGYGWAIFRNGGESPIEDIHHYHTPASPTRSE